MSHFLKLYTTLSHLKRYNKISCRMQYLSEVRYLCSASSHSPSRERGGFRGYESSEEEEKEEEGNRTAKDGGDARIAAEGVVDEGAEGSRNSSSYSSACCFCSKRSMDSSS
jgi:hypothetical protein